MAKRDLQERIQSISDYFRGIEMYNDALIVRVIFPKRWTVTDSYDGRIKAVMSDSVPQEYYYYADSANASYDDIFDIIEDTVKANETALLKLELLKNKVEELKALFADSDIPYEKLEQLEFTFKTKQKPKPKKKAKKEENKSEEAAEEPTDTIKGEESKEDVVMV